MGKALELHCTIQAGARFVTVAQMGNISLRSGEKLFSVKTKMAFTDEPFNQLFLMKEYHNGFPLPKV